MKKLSLLLLSMTIVSVNCIELPNRKILCSKQRINYHENSQERINDPYDYVLDLQTYRNIFKPKPKQKWKSFKNIKDDYAALEKNVKSMGRFIGIGVVPPPSTQNVYIRFSCEAHRRFIYAIVEQNNLDELDLSPNNIDTLFTLKKEYFEENPIQENPIQENPIQERPLQQRPYGFLYIASLVFRDIMK